MIIFAALVSTRFDFINPTNKQDPFFDSDSKSQDEYSMEDGGNEKQSEVSSSTNKELYDDLAEYKLHKNLPMSQADDVIERKAAIDDFTAAFVDAYELDNTLKPITDKKMWQRLHKYIVNNWHMFYADGSFSIPLQARYVACSYVIAFVPGQFAFVIPGFYKHLIPKKVKKVPLVREALLGMKKFFKFCKKTSRDQLFITFYFGRKNSILEDIEFIKQIPALITSDPGKIFRELFEFSIKADGYDPNM